MAQPKRSANTQQTKKGAAAGVSQGSGTKRASSTRTPKASPAAATAQVRSAGAGRAAATRVSVTRPTPDSYGERAYAGPMHAPVMDDGVRHDVAGVAIAVVGIALLIAVLTPTSGVLTQAVSDGLHALLGLGAFLLPAALLLWALTFFVHVPHIEPGRVAVGLGLVALAVLGLVGIAAPNIEADPSLLFNAYVLADRGGYIGNGLAWLLLTLVGRMVGVIVLLGLAVAGLIVIGFSATELLQGLLTRSRQRRAYARARSEERAAAAAREQHMAWVQRGGAEMPVDYAPTALFDPNRPLSRPVSVPGDVAVPGGIPTTELYDAYGCPVSVAPGSYIHMGSAVPTVIASPEASQDASWIAGPSGSVVRRVEDGEALPTSHTYGCGVAPYGGVGEDGAPVVSVAQTQDAASGGEAFASKGPEHVAGSTATAAVPSDSIAGDPRLHTDVPVEGVSRVRPARRLSRAGQWWDPADDWVRDDFDPEEYALRSVSALVPGVLPGAPVDVDDYVPAAPDCQAGDVSMAHGVSQDVLGNARVAEDIPSVHAVGAAVVSQHEGDVVDRISSLTRTALDAEAATASVVRRGSRPVSASASGTVSSEVDLPWDEPAPGVETPQASVAGADGAFALPSPAIFKRGDAMDELSPEERGEAAETAARLQSTLIEFGVEAQVKDWVEGPTCTTYQVNPGAGVRVNKFTALEDDIARILARESVRIYAPVPGTSYVGIEVSRAKRRSVNFGDLLAHLDGGPLDIAIGLDTSGMPVHANLAKLPHLLIAGTTGSGKSVCVNAMIVSLLMRNSPEDVRLILVDPKQVEFVGYNGIPHLIMPVVTDMRQAAAALQWGVTEMDRRYRLFSTLGVRDLAGYNELADSGAFDNGESPLQHLPSVVIVIDELADLMMVAKKDVEGSIVRIAQLGRAAGIHLIIATQSPRADTVTGLIRANIAARVALRVSKGTESRIILDDAGAEKLLPHGDMLFLDPGWGDKPRRIQGCYVSDPEICQVVEHLKVQPATQYTGSMAPLPGTQITAVFPDEGMAIPGPVGGSGRGGTDDEPLAWEAAKLVVENQLGSTSMIQRRLKAGYARAGRIMDMLEEMGVVGPAQGSKPRDVLVRDLEELATLLGDNVDGSEEDY